MIKKLAKEVKKLFLYSLCASIVLITVYLVIGFIIQFYSIEANKYEIINNELLINNVEKTIISGKINDLITDALYISDSLHLMDIDDDNYTGIKNQWLAFANRKEVYEQIRFIDPYGNEIIRVNYTTDEVVPIPKDDIQYQIDKECVDNAITLKKGEVFISKLNTGMEEESDEERPRVVPALLVATPYYNQEGDLEGVIVLDYTVADMVNQVKYIGSTSYGNLYLLNLNDELSYNVDIGNESRYKGRIADRFEQEFADEWESMKKADNSFMITENGFFSWANILTSEEFELENAGNAVVLDDTEWYIVSHISTDSFEGKIFSLNFWERIRYLLMNYKVDFIFIIVIAFIFGIQMTLSKIKKDKIKYFSEYDTLTDVYNRRAVFEKLSKLYKNSGKEKGTLSVCFIDINGLKEVNDYLGHDTGDELILTIVNCIKKNTRETDLISRLGGDEFLIIFSNMDAEEAEKIWMRISTEFEKINENENRKYIISASHGIEERSIESDESISTIIDRADEKMYHEKRSLKNDIRVIRDWPME